MHCWVGSWGLRVEVRGLRVEVSGWEAEETHEECKDFAGVGVGGCENRLHLQRACRLRVNVAPLVVEYHEHRKSLFRFAVLRWGFGFRLKAIGRVARTRKAPGCKRLSRVGIGRMLYTSGFTAKPKYSVP